ncbi:MAG: hypothetical protein P8Z80_05935 [Pseudolabrys sp.]|jgi:hypothetical protein
MTKTSPRSTLVRLAGGALLVAAALSLAACETTGTGASAPVAAAQPAGDDNPMAADTVTKTKGPMTHRQAALYCWMSTEHGRKDLPLGKRADVVDKCIKEKMAEH